jgi:hypothetical protein
MDDLAGRRNAFDARELDPLPMSDDREPHTESLASGRLRPR